MRRVGLDLRDRAELAGFLTGLRVDHGTVPVVVTEGLLPYLSPAQTAALAGALGAAGGAVWLTDLLSVESARGMTQLARSAGTPVELSGLPTLAPFEAHGWVATDYRILPVARRGPAGPRPGRGGGAPPRASHQVVDGVATLRMPGAGSHRGR